MLKKFPCAPRNLSPFTKRYLRGGDSSPDSSAAGTPVNHLAGGSPLAAAAGARRRTTPVMRAPSPLASIAGGSNRGPSPVRPVFIGGEDGEEEEFLLPSSLDKVQ